MVDNSTELGSTELEELIRRLRPEDGWEEWHKGSNYVLGDFKFESGYNEKPFNYRISKGEDGKYTIGIRTHKAFGSIRALDKVASPMIQGEPATAWMMYFAALADKYNAVGVEQNFLRNEDGVTIDNYSDDKTFVAKYVQDSSGNEQINILGTKYAFSVKSEEDKISLVLPNNGNLTTTVVDTAKELGILISEKNVNEDSREYSHLELKKNDEAVFEMLYWADQIKKKGLKDVKDIYNLNWANLNSFNPFFESL